jgi:hypothetical protein
MSFTKTVASSVAALAIMGVAASATTPTSGTGNYLVNPATYQVGDLWSTKITVANTNTTKAVIARVVVREPKDSKELFDFPIYLTPGDVWDGTLKSVGGKLVVESTDDSNIIKNGSSFIQASPSNPIDNGEAANIPAANYPLTYVEVFALTAYDAASIDSAWQPFTDMNKTKLFNHARNTSDPRNLNTTYAEAPGYDLIGRQAIVATDSANAENRRFMSYNSYAMHLTECYNSLLVGVIATDTTLDAMCGGANVAQAKADMNASLATNEVYALYEGDGTKVSDFRVLFTTPIKKYLVPAEAAAFGFDGNASSTLANIDSSFTYDYNITGRDMSENVRRCQPILEDTDYSGVDVNNTECVPEIAPNEVEVLKYEGLTDDALAKAKYVFPSGGYVTYDMNGFTPILPTEFTSTIVDGMIMVNHLDAQNK